MNSFGSFRFSSLTPGSPSQKRWEAVAPVCALVCVCVCVWVSMCVCVSTCAHTHIMFTSLLATCRTCRLSTPFIPIILPSHHLFSPQSCFQPSPPSPFTVMQFACLPDPVRGYPFLLTSTATTCTATTQDGVSCPVFSAPLVIVHGARLPLWPENSKTKSTVKWSYVATQSCTCHYRLGLLNSLSSDIRPLRRTASLLEFRNSPHGCGVRNFFLVILKKKKRKIILKKEEGPKKKKSGIPPKSGRLTSLHKCYFHQQS